MSPSLHPFLENIMLRLSTYLLRVNSSAFSYINVTGTLLLADASCSGNQTIKVHFTSPNSDRKTP